MSEMERVAKALHARRYGVGATWERVMPKHQERYRQDARAAIEAMRITDIIYYVDGRPHASPFDIDWNKRIDAILKKEPSPSQTS